jgi:hypothetical protein
MDSIVIFCALFKPAMLSLTIILVERYNVDYPRIKIEEKFVVGNMSLRFIL